MEIVKINLTAEKVHKLMDKAEAARNNGNNFSIAHKYPVVETFVEALQSKLGFEKVVITHDHLVAGSIGKAKDVSTFFIDKGQKTCYGLQLDGAKVEFTYNEKNDCIELWWLEVTKKNAGLGTEIMNAILDTIDELSMKLYLTPVPFAAKVRTKRDYANAFYRLRDWYSSFGFERIGKHTPSMIYA